MGNDANDVIVAGIEDDVVWVKELSPSYHLFGPSQFTLLKCVQSVSGGDI